MAGVVAGIRAADDVSLHSSRPDAGMVAPAVGGGRLIDDGGSLPSLNPCVVGENAARRKLLAPRGDASGRTRVGCGELPADLLRIRFELASIPILLRIGRVSRGKECRGDEVAPLEITANNKPSDRDLSCSHIDHKHLLHS